MWMTFGSCSTMLGYIIGKHHGCTNTAPSCLRSLNKEIDPVLKALDTVVAEVGNFCTDKNYSENLTSLNPWIIRFLSSS